jgi:hypothetical protein
VATLDEHIDDLTAAVVDYLRDHPEAGDTVEGMAHWWMYRQRLVRVRETIERVCEQLVAHGVLVRRVGADGEVIYYAATYPDGAHAGD